MPEHGTSPIRMDGPGFEPGDHPREFEWTIVYASLLTDAPASGSVVVLAERAKRRMSQEISRADVAAWMVQTATGVQHSRRSVGITG